MIGLINFTPLNCNSMSDGICVKHVERGQSVTLCTSHTTTPSAIPKGKHVISVSVYYWRSHTRILYICYNSTCKPGTSNVRNFLYPNVTNSCLTIKNIQNNSKYSLDLYFNGAQLDPYSIAFSVICGGMCERALAYHQIAKPYFNFTMYSSNRYQSVVW